MEDGRVYANKVEASNIIGKKKQINQNKVSWYIHIKSLPEVIKNNKFVQNDLTACSAYTAMKTMPMNSLVPELKENEYEYIEPYFSGFGESAIMC